MKLTKLFYQFETHVHQKGRIRKIITRGRIAETDDLHEAESVAHRVPKSGRVLTEVAPKNSGVPTGSVDKQNLVLVRRDVNVGLISGPLGGDFVDHERVFRESALDVE